MGVIHLICFLQIAMILLSTVVRSCLNTILENIHNSRKFPPGIAGTVDSWEFPGIPVLDFPVEITACTGNKVKHGVKKLVSTIVGLVPH